MKLISNALFFDKKMGFVEKIKQKKIYINRTQAINI